MKAGTTSGDRFRSWPEILANAARAAGGLRALGVAREVLDIATGRGPPFSHPHQVCVAPRTAAACASASAASFAGKRN